MLNRTTYKSPIGLLTLEADENSLIGLYMENQRYFEDKSQVNDHDCESSNPVLIQTKLWLDRYFAGEKPLVGELPLAPEGSPFRKLIWKMLCEIPYGETMTYGDLAKKAAKKLGKDKMSAQAVGGAIGHNPISIIIPCHRVVGTDGSLTGYGGGLDRKKWLLTHECVDIKLF